MGVRCERCRFYRAGSSPARTLRKLIAPSFGIDAQQGLRDMEREEDELAAAGIRERNSNVDALGVEAPAALEVWSHRPVEQSFCGIREDDGVYLLHEVKNADSRCVDYRAAPAGRHRCGACSSNVLAGGDRVLSEVGRVLAQFEGANGPVYTEVARAYHALVAVEVREAVATNGRLEHFAAALPLCAARSRPGRAGHDGPMHVAGPLVNANDTCEVGARGRPGTHAMVAWVGERARAAGGGGRALEDVLAAALEYLGLGSLTDSVLADLGSRRGAKVEVRIHSLLDELNKNQPRF